MNRSTVTRHAVRVSDEESHDNEGNVVLLRTGSDEPVDSVVRTTGSDEPVSSVTPCWTVVEECVVYVGEVSLPRTGSGDSLDGVTRTSGLDDPDDSCDVGGQSYVRVTHISVDGDDTTAD